MLRKVYFLDLGFIKARFYGSQAKLPIKSLMFLVPLHVLVIYSSRSSKALVIKSVICLRCRYA